MQVWENGDLGEFGRWQSGEEMEGVDGRMEREEGRGRGGTHAFPPNHLVRLSLDAHKLEPRQGDPVRYATQTHQRCRLGITGEQEVGQTSRGIGVCEEMFHDRILFFLVELHGISLVPGMNTSKG